MGNPAPRINRAQRRLLHEMYGAILEVYLVHSYLILKRTAELRQFNQGYTPGELKHVQQTIEDLQKVRKRVTQIHYRLKF